MKKIKRQIIVALASFFLGAVSALAISTIYFEISFVAKIQDTLSYIAADSDPSMIHNWFAQRITRFEEIKLSILVFSAIFAMVFIFILVVALGQEKGAVTNSKKK